MEEERRGVTLRGKKKAREGAEKGDPSVLNKPRQRNEGGMEEGGGE